MSNDDKQAPTKSLAVKVIHAAIKILMENGNEMPIRDIMEKIEKTVDLNKWERERYEKTGYIRWTSVLHFYSIGFVKAGYLIKKKGIWYLTPEGEKALMSIKPEQLLEKADEAYYKWQKEHPRIQDKNGTDVIPEHAAPSFDEYEQKAMESLQHFVNQKNPYEFQDLVAALLRGMGYYTPFVAPKGKDGGVDIVAYKDPLGTESPRIQVQIKHRESAATGPEVRQLMGLLQKAGDVGIFVSTSGFTPDGKAEVKKSHAHVELIDLNRFISLWQEFYNKMNEEDKSLMSIRPIYFLAPEE